MIHEIRKFPIKPAVIIALLCLTAALFQFVPVVHAGETGVSREEYRLTIADNNVDLPYVLYYPPGYDENRPEPYPLLVLLHGHDMTLRTWDELALSDALASLTNEPEFSPFVVLTVLETDNLRDIFYSDFDDHIINELLPEIEGLTNVGGDRQLRALGGISRGAYWAADIAFRRPDIFRVIGLHSLPGTPFSDTTFNNLMREAAKRGNDFVVYLDAGNIDTYRMEGRKLNEQLDRAGIVHSWNIFPGGHDLTYWRERLPDYLRWYGSSFTNGSSDTRGMLFK